MSAWKHCPHCLRGYTGDWCACAAVVPTVRVLSIKGCARCDGKGHDDLHFAPLDHPVVLAGESLTHWADCPTNGQPILLCFKPKEGT